jgi:hypothetical protein
MEGLEKRIVVVNGVAGRTPIRKGVQFVPKNMATLGVGTDAASTRSPAQTLLEMGPRFCRPISPYSSLDK